MAIATLTLSSCDEADDYDIAYNLEGIWQGSLGQAYYDQFGEGYDNWETEFRFYTSADATSGTGVEIDYNPNAWSRYQQYYFKWNVAYGDIYLYFSDGQNLVLHDYRMSSNRLQGSLRTMSGTYVADLDLVRTDYWPWNDSYAKGTRATGTATPEGPRRTFEGLKR